MKPIFRELLKGLGSLIVEKVLGRVLRGRTAPTTEELDEALTVGGPTAEAAARARREVEERKLREAAGLSMVADDEAEAADADEAPSFGHKPWPPRDELN